MPCRALQLSRQADPEGQRTLGVITKLDLGPNEERKSLRDKIMQLGKHRLKQPVELGFIGVCNWISGTNATNTRSLVEAEKSEQKFIGGCAELAETPESHLGIPALVEKLCHLQRQHRFLAVLSCLLTDVVTELCCWISIFKITAVVANTKF